MGRYITTTGTVGTVLKTVEPILQAVGLHDRILCTLTGGFTLYLLSYKFVRK